MGVGSENRWDVAGMAEAYMDAGMVKEHRVLDRQVGKACMVAGKGAEVGCMMEKGQGVEV
jgi:hypothetical protein